MNKKEFIKIFNEKFPSAVSIWMEKYTESVDRKDKEYHKTITNLPDSKFFIKSIDSFPDIFFDLITNEDTIKLGMFSQSCQIHLQFCCVTLGSNYTNINFYFSNSSDSYDIRFMVIKKGTKDFLGPHIISGK